MQCGAKRVPGIVESPEFNEHLTTQQRKERNIAVVVQVQRAGVESIDECERARRITARQHEVRTRQPNSALAERLRGQVGVDGFQKFGRRGEIAQSNVRLGQEADRQIEKMERSALT